VTNRAIAHARLRNSRLVGPRAPLATPEDVVRWFGAVQSQDVPGAFWAVAQRMAPSTTAEEVGAAFDAGRIVRTHALRPTWHFLAPDELRWIQALTGGRVHKAAGSQYRRRGLGDGEFRLAEDVMRTVLRGGRALTRDELGIEIAASGLDLSDNLVTTHLAMHAELEAVICSGPRRGKRFTYQLVDERIPPARPCAREDSLRELTLRYFTSHGPALPQDMSWWSGLTVTDVRQGIELAGHALEGRRVDGKEYWAAATAFDPRPGDVPEPFVRLLSNYDEYLGSYTDYSPIFDLSLPKARNVADVLGAHIVVCDGLVVGGWRRALRDGSALVTVTLLLPLTTSETAALEAEAEAYGSFLGLPVDLRVVAT
jgi:hypothetical protein